VTKTAEPDAIRVLRRELGRQLAVARAAAGYTQGGFAQRISYARSTISTVESGVQRAGRSFWDACDRALRTGGTFARGYERIRAERAAVRQAVFDLSLTAGSPAESLRAATVADALIAFEALGWPTASQGGMAELVTGTVLDALEVPQAAGELAACWWRCTGGAADQVRGLPELPDPARALAAIACAGRFFFLVAAGSCPWSGNDVAARPARAYDAPLIGWHSTGSRIPAPPSAGSGGHPAAWAHLPSGEIDLACPIFLLDLLARAVAATRHPRAIALPGGVLAVPAAGLRAGPAPAGRLRRAAVRRI